MVNVRCASVPGGEEDVVMDANEVPVRFFVDSERAFLCSFFASSEPIGFLCNVFKNFFLSKRFEK